MGKSGVLMFDLSQLVTRPAVAWDAGVAWGATLTWERPFNARQLDMLDQKVPNLVVSVRPVWGGTWLAMAVPAKQAWHDMMEPECEEGDEMFEVRFGVAPKGWVAGLDEFDGW